MDEAVELALAQINRQSSPVNRQPYVVTPNPEIVQLCRGDERVRNAVNNAALVLPDGIGIIHAARILRRPIKNRIPGIDFGERLLAELATLGKSVYLLGAKPGSGDQPNVGSVPSVAEVAGVKLAERYPGLVIAGWRDGYFTDDRPVMDDIRAKKPDVLFACLGAPKQELWMAEHCAWSGAGLMIGLGGALDVWAGNATRAPGFMRRLGLEWLYRLIAQPSRIGRVIKLPLFLCAAVRARLTMDN